MIDRAVMLFPHLIDTFGVDMTFSSLSPFTFHLLMSSSTPAVLIFFVLFLVFTHLLWSLLPPFVFLLSFMFAVRHFEIYKVPYK